MPSLRLSHKRTHKDRRQHREQHQGEPADCGESDPCLDDRIGCGHLGHLWRRLLHSVTAAWAAEELGGLRCLGCNGEREREGGGSNGELGGHRELQIAGDRSSITMYHHSVLSVDKGFFLTTRRG